MRRNHVEELSIYFHNKDIDVKAIAKHIDVHVKNRSRVYRIKSNLKGLCSHTVC